VAKILDVRDELRFVKRRRRIKTSVVTSEGDVHGAFPMVGTTVSFKG
jgi:hypothetical protein